MKELDTQALNTAIARSEKSAELYDQPAQGKHQSPCFAHFRRQFEAGVKPLRRHEELARIGQDTQRPVQFLAQRTPETLGEPCARQGEHFADGAHTDGFQRCKNARVAIECLDRQRLQPSSEVAKVGAGGGRASAGKQPGPVCARRRGWAGGIAHLRGALRKARGDSRSAAEKFQAAGHFKQQPFGAGRAGHKRDFRRITAGPRGDPLECCTLRGCITLVEAKAGRKRGRSCTSHAGAHALGESRCVAVNDMTVLRHRPGLSRGRGAQERFERQARQGQRGPVQRG